MEPLQGRLEALGAGEHVPELLLQHLDIEKLLGVFPFVEGFRFVETLIALEANERVV